MRVVAFGVLLVWVAFGPACAALKAADDRAPDLDGGLDAAVDARADGAEPADAGPCPIVLDNLVPRVAVSAPITTDTTWDCHRVYVLENVVHVAPPATLTIRPGTNVLGELGSGLVVTRGAKLVAEGTAQNPIVFSSAKIVGQRSPGAWGGVLLLGSAATNVGTTNVVPPLATTDAQGMFGGNDDTTSCGSLRYVRIEFAGDAFPGGRENVPALGLAGCGDGTNVDFVQVHLANGDALKLWGGAVNIRHVIGTGVYGDFLSARDGYHGKLQFLMGQEAAARDGRGIALQNGETTSAWNAVPRTNPLLYNFTLVGQHDPSTRRSPGILFSAGALGRFHNGSLLGFGGAAVAFENEPDADPALVYGVPATGAPSMTVETTNFFEFGADDMTFFPPPKDGGVGAFEPSTYFRAPERRNSFGLNPQCHNCYLAMQPAFTPGNDEDPALGMSGDQPPADGFFTPLPLGAQYVGAAAIPRVEPDWSLGWTVFRAN